jgi:hypothetical protein
MNSAAAVPSPPDRGGAVVITSAFEIVEGKLSGMIKGLWGISRSPTGSETLGSTEPGAHVLEMCVLGSD